MKFIKSILKFILFPIYWFWEKYNECKEEENFGKLILLFSVSLSGLILIVIALWWSVNYILTNCPEAIVIGGLIIWLYSYAKSKIFSNSTEPITAPQNNIANNETLYPKIGTRINLVTDIMLVVSQKVAPKLHCVVASTVDEIIDTAYRYDIVNNVIFFVIRLEKEDIGELIDENTLKLFIQILQAKLDHLTTSSHFRNKGFPTECDLGNVTSRWRTD